MDACDESSADESQSFVQSSDEDSEAVTERQNGTESRSFDGIQKHSVPTQQFRVRATPQSLASEDSTPCYLPETQLSKESPGSGSPKCKSKGTAKDMSERERGLRNRNSKVERACFNAAAGSSQSRNHLHQHHRHESEARNRPREKSQNSNRNHCALNFERRSDFMTVTGAATAANSVNEKMAVDSAVCEEDEEEDSSQKNESSSDSKVISSFPPIPVVHNWQATKSSVKERLGFMFCNELMADVFFIVGKNGPRQRIPAHRFVLSIGSAVFDAMFNGGMATDEKEIELPDIEPAAFLCLMKFFYSDEVRIGPDTVMASLYAAKKYAVPALELGCVDYLKKHLSSDNAFMLLMQARLFDEPHLATMCLEMIDKTTSEALVADGFTDIDLDTLCIVLERDTLGIKECKLFAAVARWAEAECNRQGVPATPENHRLVLGRALHLIRFPLMTVEEFAVGAAQSGILTDREALELFLYFTVNPKPHVNFSGVLRCCLTGKEQVVSRFCEIENRWGYSGTSDRIR